MSSNKTDYKAVCKRLLEAESEDEVTQILKHFDLLQLSHWRLLGDMPNNRSMVNNQAQDPAGALVEKVTNSIDAMLTKECFLHGVVPDSPDAPKTMMEASERFFKIPDGNLANLTAGELTRLAENIQVAATGSKQEPNYLIVDKGEGQTPTRFKDTFLSLVRANKARIPFVQGKFNCGGTGVLPFCGKYGYELIISRRCSDLPSNPSVPSSKDSTHSLWGFTVIRKVLPSAGLYDTTVYMYLAPDGQIPCFDSPAGILVIPEVTPEIIAKDIDDEDILEEEEPAKKKDKTPRPYRVGLPHGTIMKLYNYKWKARSLATTDVRFELERYLYHLSLPVRVIETRPGYNANYFATTVSGTSVTISKDRDKGFLEDIPEGGELHPDGIGSLPISVTLYRERVGDKKDKKEKKDKSAKDPRRIPKGLYFTINGQVHYSLAPEFFVTRGLNYEFIKNTMLVTVDCTGLTEDIRDQLIMPSRDRLRKIPEFEAFWKALSQTSRTATRYAQSTMIAGCGEPKRP